jgi:uncharacterized protein YutD
MEKLEFNNINYELVDNYREAFDLDTVKEALTDYYVDFDYIVGDWAYNKLRLKGFYEDNNPKCNRYNKIADLDKYLANNCAFGCKWFKLKKLNN